MLEFTLECNHNVLNLSKIDLAAKILIRLKSELISEELLVLVVYSLDVGRPFLAHKSHLSSTRLQTYFSSPNRFF